MVGFIQFDKVFIHEMDEAVVTAVESDYINEFRPKYNVAMRAAPRFETVFVAAK